MSWKSRKKYIYMAQELISKIEQSIANSGKTPAFIPFVEVGYPDFEFSKRLFYLFQEKGAAAIEVGIPFSDPLADGPVIQKASKIALQNGASLKKAFELLREIKDNMTTPLILFSYLNPILHMGLDNFMRELIESGVAGVIIPDLPIEESAELQERLKQAGIDFIMLVSPASGKERIKNIVQNSSGFIYLVSSMGVTGVREGFSSALEQIYSDIKSCTSLPVAVGFGVSKPEHIAALRGMGIEGAVISSAFLKIIDECDGDKDLAITKINGHIDALYF
jgi:tryptophan synthase alpha chain